MCAVKHCNCYKSLFSLLSPQTLSSQVKKSLKRKRWVCNLFTLCILNDKVQCSPKVLEQNKIFSHNFKKIVYLNALYKQYGLKIRPKKRWAWSLIHIVWYPASVFSESFAWNDLNSEDIEIVNFTNCPRTFGGHCIYSAEKEIPHYIQCSPKVHGQFVKFTKFI